jgi:hypothetical protein
MTIAGEFFNKKKPYNQKIKTKVKSKRIPTHKKLSYIYLHTKPY